MTSVLLYGLLFLLQSSISGALTCLLPGRNIVATLTVGNGGQLGTWREVEGCPRGSYAVGYSMKLEWDQRDGDDTALNGIMLYCRRRENYYYDAGFITSGQAYWGHWDQNYTCGVEDDFLTSFQMRVEQPVDRYNFDNTAANYVLFRCRNFHGLPRIEGDTQVGRGTGLYGSWGQWSNSCPANSAICGLATKIDHRRWRGDDTALNDVKFFCCDE